MATRISRSLITKNLAVGAVNLAIFFFLIKWTIQNIKLRALLEHLHSIPLFAVVPLVIVNVISLAFHGMRLSILLPGSFGVSFQIVNLSAGFNTVFPFRLGDVARIYFARRAFHLTVSKLLATGLMEKFFDLLALGILTLLVLIFSSDRFVGASVAVALFGVVFLAYAALLLFRRLSHNAENWFGKITKIQRLINSLREDAKVHDIPRVSLYTGAIWIANVAVVFVGFAGFLPGVPFDIKDAVCLLIITALAIAIPSAPAGLGVYEAGIVAYLTQVLHMDVELALACAIVFHSAMVFPQLALTAIGLFRIWLTKPPAPVLE